MVPQIEEGHDPETENKESYGVMNENGEYFVAESDSKRILKKFKSLRSKRQEYLKGLVFMKS